MTRCPRRDRSQPASSYRGANLTTLASRGTKRSEAGPPSAQPQPRWQLSTQQNKRGNRRTRGRNCQLQRTHPARLKQLARASLPAAAAFVNGQVFESTRRTRWGVTIVSATAAVLVHWREGWVGWRAHSINKAAVTEWEQANVSKSGRARTNGHVPRAHQQSSVIRPVPVAMTTTRRRRHRPAAGWS